MEHVQWHCLYHKTRFQRLDGAYITKDPELDVLKPRINTLRDGRSILFTVQGSDKLLDEQFICSSKGGSDSFTIGYSDALRGDFLSENPRFLQRPKSSSKEKPEKLRRRQTAKFSSVDMSRWSQHDFSFRSP
ncbi:hypothetical protein CHS0354_006436 [Potamilus streckersoni]|uniref:Uncharacterized protein n=1 Tax=Potamilus streckersoni TaxID=2493646 RepID=A0AAE0T934_9BIVA|nr:hypothetical protein CHS0354_006436 [Potamilus streckersoni]